LYSFEVDTVIQKPSATAKRTNAIQKPSATTNAIQKPSATAKKIPNSSATVKGTKTPNSSATAKETVAPIIPKVCHLFADVHSPRNILADAEAEAVHNCKDPKLVRSAENSKGMLTLG
jgi:hypothetical protein